MANINITAKRYNGGGWDTLNFSTIIAQVSGLQDALDAKVASSLIGAADGVASLNSSGKVPDAQLPASVFGGMKFAGTVSKGVDYTPENAVLGQLVSNSYAVLSLSTDLVTLVGEALSSSNYNKFIGYYFIMTEAINMGEQTDGGYVTDAVYDDGVNADDYGIDGPLLEAGDWVVVTGWDGSHLTFSIVNNTYANADSSAYGVVKLSDATTYDVITESILKTVINNADFALDGHDHDSDYLGISATAVAAAKWATARTITLGGDLSGNVSIDGSQNVTLTATVANDSHNHNTGNIDDYTGTAFTYLTGLADNLNAILYGFDQEFSDVDSRLDTLEGFERTFYVDIETSISSPVLNDIAFVY